MHSASLSVYCMHAMETDKCSSWLRGSIHKLSRVICNSLNHHTLGRKVYTDKNENVILVAFAKAEKVDTLTGGRMACILAVEHACSLRTNFRPSSPT